MTQAPENIIVEAGDVSFSYPDRQDRYVLNKLNLQVRQGECAGKTTLLKLLCGLLKPVQGQVLFEGKPLQGPRNDIALIFQNYGLFPWKTVRENILLPARLRKKRADENELAELLDYLGLREFARRFPAELSGGQLQRRGIPPSDG